MFGRTEKKFSLVKLTAFVVLLDVFLVVFIFISNGGNVALARDMFLKKVAGGFNLLVERFPKNYAAQSLKLKEEEIESRIQTEKGIQEFEDGSKLSLAGETEDRKGIVEKEKGVVLGEETTAVSSEQGSVNSDLGNQGNLETEEITAEVILEALNYDLTYQDIAKRGVRRWNLNTNAVRSRKILDYSIEARDIDDNSINSRIIENASVHSRDLTENIRIRGNFTVNGNTFLDQNVEIDGTVTAPVAVVTTLSGTTLTYATGNITTLNAGTIDLGTNTITDGNFTGNWDFNTGSLSGLGNLLPDVDDTYDLGSNTLRWRSVYLGGETLHIGASTSDEYTIGYDTASNKLEFNVNGSGNPEIVFDSSGNVGIGTSAPDRKLRIVDTNTGTADGGYTSATSELYISPSADQGVRYSQAFSGEIYVPDSSTNDIYGISGIAGSAENGGTGSIVIMEGLEGWAYNYANASIGQVLGAYLMAESDAGAVSYLAGAKIWSGSYGGTVQNQYGIVLEDVASNGSSVTNRYGLYMPAFTGSATNDFGIYQAGSAQKNYFAGNVGIGTTAPGNKLTVSGGVGIGTTAPGSLFLSTAAPDGGMIVEGNVGIGTTAPTNKLTVNGNGNFTGHVAIGANSAVDDGSLLWPAYTYKSLLSLQENITDFSRDEQAGIVDYLRLDPTGAVSSAVYGIDTQINIPSGNIQNFGGLNGISSYIYPEGSGNISYIQALSGMVDYYGSGTLNVAQGIYLYAANESSGNITNSKGAFIFSGNYGNGNIATSYGLQTFGALNYGSGTISTAYGILIDSPDNSGGGTVYNNYGLYIKDQSAVGSTNSFNFFSAGANSKNYFAGNVGIGTTAPGNKLTVSGGVGIGTTAPGSVYLSTVAPDGGMIIEGNVGIGTTSPTTKLSVYYSEDTANATNEGDATFWGIANPTSNTTKSMWGTGFNSEKTGSHDIGTLASLWAGSSQDGSGHITNLVGGWFGNDGDGAGSVDNNYEIWIQGNMVSSATNHVALNIDEVTGGTNKYAIRYDAPSPFVVTGAGNVGIGTTAPGNKLAVSGGVGIGTTAPGSLFLSTAAPDGGMIIEGNVGIGTTSPDQALDVIGTIQSSDLLGGATTVSTDASGNIIRTPSDIKLKENIIPMEDPLSKVLALRGVTYYWKDKSRFGSSQQIGFIAQDVEKIIPQVVTSGGEYKSLNYQNLTVVLAGAIQQQQGKINKISNDQFSISNEFSNLNDQTIGMDDKLKIISTSLLELDSRTADLKTQLAQAQIKLKDQENNLLTFETATNDLLSSMMDTEKMLTEKILLHEDRIKALEDKIATLSVSGGGEIPAGVVTQDTQGNVVLAGILNAKGVSAETASFKGVIKGGELQVEKVESKGIVAGDYSVKVDEKDSATIGNGKILEVKKDEDKDGIDDETGSDGKSVVVKTSAAKEDSKIFITSRTMLDQPLAVTKIKSGESFTVEKKSATNQDIEFDWWIVESR